MNVDPQPFALTLVRSKVVIPLCILVLFPVLALSQADTINRAPVVVDGKPLFEVRHSVKGYSAEMRAKLISQRVESAAADFSVNPDSIVVQESDISSDIIVGDTFLMFVVDRDAAGIGKSRHELAEGYAAAMRKSVAEYRASRSSDNVIRGVLLSALATVILLGALILIGKITNSILTALKSRIRSIKIAAQDVIQASWIEYVLVATTRIVRFALIFACVYAYLGFVLGNFIWTSRLAKGLIGLVLNPLQKMAMGFILDLPDLFFIAVLIFIARYALRLIKFFFFEVEKGSVALPNFSPEWAKPTYKLVRTLVLLLTVVIAYPYIPGSSSAAFQGISIFAGLLFSLGSSSAVSNIVAGTILTYMRAFKVGDVVLVGEARGIVVETTLLVTRIRTPKNVEVAIPNSTILNAQVTNFSNQAKEGKLILPTVLTIGYDAPWRQIHAMLKLAADKTDGVLKSPEPFILQLGLDDFYVRYELNVYVDDATKMLATYSGLHKNIQDTFNEYGVQIMSPHFESESQKPAIVPKERWYEAPAKDDEKGGRGEPKR